MHDLRSIIGSAFVLIGIYLFIANGDKTAKVINTLAYNSVEGIKALQGR